MTIEERKGLMRLWLAAGEPRACAVPPLPGHDEIWIIGKAGDACARLLSAARTRSLRLERIYHSADIDIAEALALKPIADAPLRALTFGVTIAKATLMPCGSIAFVLRPDDGVKRFDEATFWNEPTKLRAAPADELEDESGGMT